MHLREYTSLRDVEPAALVALLNKPRNRLHLVAHAPFTDRDVRAWIDEKLRIDASPGCRVRAVTVGGRLAGWCAIQREGEHHELAIVLDDVFWGLGPAVFRDLMSWAHEMRLTTVLIRFLSTRPPYRFLCRRARRIYDSEWMGRRFTTYELAVEQARPARGREAGRGLAKL